MTINENDVDLAVENVLKKTDHSNLETYQLAVHSNKKGARYKHSLIACALAPSDEAGFFAASDAVGPLSEILQREVALADFQKHLDAFLTKDRAEVLVRRGTAKKFRYRFHEPIMQPFAIMRAIKEKVISPRSRSLLSYNPQRSLSI